MHYTSDIVTMPIPQAPLSRYLYCKLIAQALCLHNHFLYPPTQPRQSCVPQVATNGSGVTIELEWGATASATISPVNGTRKADQQVEVGHQHVKPRRKSKSAGSERSVAMGNGAAMEKGGAVALKVASPPKRKVGARGMGAWRSTCGMDGCRG